MSWDAPNWALLILGLITLGVAALVGEMRLRRVRKFTEEWVQPQDAKGKKVIVAGISSEVLSVSLYTKSGGTLTPVSAQWDITPNYEMISPAARTRICFKALETGVRYVVFVVG